MSVANLNAVNSDHHRGVDNRVALWPVLTCDVGRHSFCMPTVRSAAYLGVVGSRSIAARDLPGEQTFTAGGVELLKKPSVHVGATTWSIRAVEFRGLEVAHLRRVVPIFCFI